MAGKRASAKTTMTAKKTRTTKKQEGRTMEPGPEARPTEAAVNPAPYDVEGTSNNVGTNQSVPTPKPESEKPKGEECVAMISVETAAKMFSKIRSEDRNLPKFYGEVLEWPNFIEKYRRTTAEHGIDDSANRERLLKSLRSSALRLVEDKLKHTCLINQVLRDLEREYGGESSMLTAAISRVNKVKPLDPELNHIKTFVIDALKIQMLIKQGGAEALEKTVLLTMKNLLPKMVSKYWADFQRNIGKPDRGCFDDFVEFLEELQRDTHTSERQRKRERSRSASPLYKDRRFQTYKRYKAAPAPHGRDSRPPHRVLYTRPEQRRGDSGTRQHIDRRSGFEERRRHLTPPQRTTEDDKKNQVPCILGCRTQHKLIDCPLFNNAKQPERFQILRKYDRCVYCCGDHKVNMCKERQKK